MLALLAMALWGGCSPEDFLASDEDRERNYQRARDAERLGDYEAASEYYERALEKNSRAPSVHLGYAALCESQLRRYPDAVYHYQRYLRLRPEDPKADDIRRRITNCTERLATSVPLVIRSETIARDLGLVRAENISLHGQITNLVAVVLQQTNEIRSLNGALAQLQSQYQAQAQSLAQAQVQLQAALAAASAGGPGPSGANGGAGQLAVRPYSPPKPLIPGPAVGPQGTRPPEPPAAVRTHRVQSGETLDRIARRYGIPVKSLQLANPRVDARHIRSGTELKIPAR